MYISLANKISFIARYVCVCVCVYIYIYIYIYIYMSQILAVKSSKGYIQKSLEVTLLFINFSKAIYSIHRGKMEQILLAYGLPKETVTVIIKLMKAMVCSPHEGTDFFDIVAEVLQRDTLAPYLLVICLHSILQNIDRSNKRKWF